MFQRVGRYGYCRNLILVTCPLQIKDCITALLPWTLLVHPPHNDGIAEVKQNTKDAKPKRECFFVDSDPKRCCSCSKSCKTVPVLSSVKSHSKLIALRDPLCILTLRPLQYDSLFLVLPPAYPRDTRILGHYLYLNCPAITWLCVCYAISYSHGVS